MTHNFDIARFKVYIGPRHLPDTDPAHYNWGVHEYDLNEAVGQSVNLSSTLNSGDTTASCDGSTDLFHPGGIWIEGNGTGEGIEYCSCTGGGSTTITGLGRESTTYREHNGKHSSGAAVYSLYPLEDNDGELHMTYDYENENLSATRWTATLSGFNVLQPLMRNNHVVVIQFLASGDYSTMLVGFTDSAKMRADYHKHNTWTMTVSSSHLLLSHQEIKGISVGDLDMAKHGTATSSPPLGSAFKERNSGDYVAASPSFAAKQVLNSDEGTIWIADSAVGTNNYPGDDWTDFAGLSQMYLNPHPGRGDKLKWVELVNDDGYGAFMAAWRPTDGGTIQMGWPQAWIPASWTYIVFTEDVYTFAVENPSYVGDALINILELDAQAHTFLDYCLPAGGAIAMRDSNGYWRGVYWGYIGDEYVPSDNLPVSWGSIGFEGPPVTAPEYGEVMRRLHYIERDPLNDGLNWVTDNVSSPGQTIEEDATDEGYGAWLAVRMPDLGIYLAADYSSGTSVINLVNAAGDPNTEGLDTTGNIQIGDEQYAYTNKTDTSITITGNTNDDHAEGDSILPVENGIACDAHSISDTIIKYIPDLGNGFDSVRVWYSRHMARDPGMDSDFWGDYASPYGGVLYLDYGSDPLGTIDRHEINIDWSAEIGADIRLKTLLLEFRKGEQSPHMRPRVSRVICNVNIDYYDPLLWLPEGTDEGDLITTMLDAAHIPSRAINVAVGEANTAISGFTTAAEKAWTVVSDFAAFAGVFIDVHYDSSITVKDDLLFSTATGGFSMDYQWDEDDVTWAEMIFTRGSSISQVKLEYVTPDTSVSNTVRYPTTANWEGTIDERGPMIYANDAAAIKGARKHYWMHNHPYTVIVELLVGNFEVKPGQFFSLNYAFSTDTTNLVTLAREFVIIAVDQQIQGGTLRTVVSGKQVDREVDF